MRTVFQCPCGARVIFCAENGSWTYDSEERGEDGPGYVFCVLALIKEPLVAGDYSIPLAFVKDYFALDARAMSTRV